MKRIAITGPESSGKTTLSLELARHYSAVLVPEFARDYLEEKQGFYGLNDLLMMAKKQADLVREAEQSKSEYLIADTEMLVLKIWCREKFGIESKLIDQLLIEQSYDLILLCKPDLPWEFDPIRELPDLNERERLFEIYRKYIIEFGWKYEVIEGSGKERTSLSIKHIDSFFRNNVAGFE